MSSSKEYFFYFAFHLRFFTVLVKARVCLFSTHNPACSTVTNHTSSIACRVNLDACMDHGVVFYVPANTV